MIIEGDAADAALLNTLITPTAGEPAGGGVHVTIPGDFLARILNGERVAGCRYFLAETDAESGLGYIEILESRVAEVTTALEGADPEDQGQAAKLLTRVEHPGWEFATEGQQIQITAEGATGPVEFYIDDVLAETVSSAPFVFLWTAIPGDHEIVAVDTEDSDEKTTLVRVVARAAALTSPDPGVYVAGSEVSFEVDTFDDEQTTGVSFRSLGNEFSLDAESPWSATKTVVDPGEYIVTPVRFTGGVPVAGPGQELRVIADPGTAPALPTHDFAIYAHSGLTLVDSRISAVTPTAGNDITAPSASARPWRKANGLSGRPTIWFRGPHELSRAAGGINLGDGGCYAVAFRMHYTNGGLQTIIRSGTIARQFFGTTGSKLANGVGGEWTDGAWQISDFQSATAPGADQNWHIAIVEFGTPDVLWIDGAQVINTALNAGAATGIQFGEDANAIGVHFELAAAVVHSGGLWDADGRAAVVAHLRHAANYPDLPAWVES